MTNSDGLLELLMTAWLFLCISMTLPAAAPAPNIEPTEFEVPAMSGTVAVDGQVEQPEWRGAIEVLCAGGTKVYMGHKAGRMYAGIASATDGIVSLYIENDDRVTVLHASYSLGTAGYVRSTETWKKLSGFKWERPDVKPGTTSNAIETNLKKRNWSGTRIDTGRAGDMELVIDDALLTPKDQSKPVRIAIAFFILDGERTAWTWPSALTDDTTSTLLQKGDTPESLTFRPETWHTLRLAREKKGGETDE